MSRSRLFAVFGLTLLLALAAGSVMAQPAGTRIDAIGVLDYLHGRGTVKVGAWVKYHVSAKSLMGVTDDYTVTVLVPGEEYWWGEECFWVETWTTSPSGVTTTAATLMSYAIFDDSLAVPHLQLYQRKMIGGILSDGSVQEQIFRQGNESVKRPAPSAGALHLKVDSVGVDTVKTPKGDFICQIVRTEQGVSSTAQSSDSSEYSENREVHIYHRNLKVPLTSLAREEMDISHWRRAWLIGRSQDSGPLRLIDRSLGQVELLDFGFSGLTARLVPKDRWHSLAEQRAAQAEKAKAPRAAPPAKTKTPAKASATSAKPTRQ